MTPMLKAIRPMALTLLAVGFLTLKAQCTTIARARLRNESNILITTGDLPQKKYIPLGIITLETFPNIYVLGILPPPSLEGQFTELEQEMRGELLNEVMEMGGNALINLEYERRMGGFSFLIPFWVTSTLIVKGEVVKIVEE